MTPASNLASNAVSNWDFPNPATAEGSAAYYVTRFSAATERDRIAHWFAWFALIDDIRRTAKDPGASRLKLDWWLKEVEFTHQNCARHPLAQALQDYVEHAWQVTQMQRLLQATERQIGGYRSSNEVDYWQNSGEHYGSRTRLLSNDARIEIAEQAEQLGCYIAVVLDLQRLGEDVRAGQLRIPKSLLQSYQLSDVDLRNNAPLPQLSELAQALLAPVAPPSLGELRGVSALHPVLRWTAQIQHLQRKLAHHRFASHRQLITLSPLTLLWSAWRMRGIASQAKT